MGERMERVVHENQLRPGLLVEMRRCEACDRTERFMLLGRGDFGTECDCGSIVAWDWAGDGCIPDEDDSAPQVCFCVAIPEGRLFIVNPFSDDQAEATTKAKPRKRERTRG